MASSAVISRVQNTVSNCILHRHYETKLVYFSNPHTGKDYYFAPRADKQPIEYFVPITYNGMSIMLDKLDEDTVATLKIEKKVITKVDVTFLRERKSMFEIYKEGFVVFSPRKFSTFMLVEDKKHDPGHLAAQTIASKCSGIRKVSSDGGKGFWTAVGLAYFEHLALDVVKEDEFSYFYGLLLGAGISDSDQVVSYLSQVRDTKYARLQHQYSDGTEHHQGEIIDRWHNNTGFQTELIKGLKAITLKYAADHPDHENAAFLDNGLTGFEIDLKHGQETSEVAIAFAACALPIKLVVYTLDSEELRQSYKCDPSHPKLTYIRLLKQSESYFILYTDNWLTVEGYNVFLSQREKAGAFDRTTVESLYYTPKDDRIQLTGCATKEMYDEALATLKRQSDLINGAESLVISTFSTFKRRTLPGTNFFDNDLLMSTYFLKSAYNKMLAQFNTLPPEASNAASGLLALEDSGVLKDLQVMKRCDRCQNAISDAVLKCGHGMCQNCFFERAAELRQQKGCIVEPSGEAARELTCPILDCQDFDPIPTRVLQQLLGDQFDAYLEEAENLRMIKKCKRCDKVYDKSKFLISSCSCKICVYCMLELVKLYNGVCMCGVPFDPYANAAASNLTETCQQCRRTLLLWKDFTTVRCSEHVLCINCLEKVLKDEKNQIKVDPRCPSCYRTFAPHEIQLAQPCFMRRCDMFCGQFFDKSGALDLPCGCHYCKNCAVSCVMANGQIVACPIVACFSCKQPFPQQLVDEWQRELKQSEFLYATIKRATLDAQNKYNALRCGICGELIGAAQRLALACSHEFHRRCVSEYFSNFVTTAVKEEIKCPKAGCGTAIPSNLLQQIASPKDFEKYGLLLLKASEAIIYCPYCNCGMYGENLQLGPDARAFCSSCNGPFCTVCMQQWQEPHDPGQCKAMYVQQSIVMLQAMAGEGSQIAQCPGCKTPCLKDDHCDHTKCAVPECQVEWCFRCSCLRVPTMKHSNAWHRPQCSFYAPSDGSEKQEPDCPECQRLKRLCDPPQNLKVKQRFAFDEY